MKIENAFGLLFVLGLIYVVFFIAFVQTSVEGEEAYKIAVAAVKNNVQVKEATGGMRDIVFFGKSYHLSTNRGVRVLLICLLTDM